METGWYMGHGKEHAISLVKEGILMPFLPLELVVGFGTVKRTVNE